VVVKIGVKYLIVIEIVVFDEVSRDPVVVWTGDWSFTNSSKCDYYWILVGNDVYCVKVLSAMDSMENGWYRGVISSRRLISTGLFLLRLLKSE